MDERDEEERKAVQQLISTLMRHTVTLVRIDAPGRGSGFVVPWSDGLRVVSARHVLAKGEWAVEIIDQQPGSAGSRTEADVWNMSLPDRRTLLARVRVDPRSVDAVQDDISWARLDVDSSALGREPELPIYNGPLDSIPHEGESYAFAAVNRDELHVDARVMLREPAFEAYMTLAALHPSEVIFSLARKHQGHEYYRGASGAPIADRSGALVGILVGEGARENELRAASLARFISAMRRID